MATVRFSEELRNRILSNAGDLFDEQVTKAEKNFPKRWGGEIYDLMFKETLAQMNALPDGYLETSSSIAIAGFKGAGWNEDNDVTVHFTLKPERRVPESFRIEGLGIKSASNYGGHTLDADDPRWDALKEEYRAYVTQLAAVKEERTTFLNGVREVLNAYSTLAPALKAWPALWDLVPERYKDRHKEIVERKKADPKVEAEVDLGKMTAAVTLGKLTR